MREGGRGEGGKKKRESEVGKVRGRERKDESVREGGRVRKGGRGGVKTE